VEKVEGKGVKKLVQKIKCKKPELPEMLRIVKSIAV
jgi:hypothetical protein